MSPGTLLSPQYARLTSCFSTRPDWRSTFRDEKHAPAISGDAENCNCLSKQHLYMRAILLSNKVGVKHLKPTCVFQTSLLRLGMSDRLENTPYSHSKHTGATE
jgi:hypothetical protein